MKVLISKSDYPCSVDSITGCQADKVVHARDLTLLHARGLVPSESKIGSLGASGWFFLEKKCFYSIGLLHTPSPSSCLGENHSVKVVGRGQQSDCRISLSSSWDTVAGC